MRYENIFRNEFKPGKGEIWRVGRGISNKNVIFVLLKMKNQK